MLLELQVVTLTATAEVRERLSAGLRRRFDDDRGEVTSTVAIIGVLVIGALAAGAIIVARMRAHAESIPNPGG